MYTIYVHINRFNLKVYVGQTKNKPKIRWGRNGKNYLRHETMFSNAIRKYGWDNFLHAIVKEGLTKEEADCVERYLIAYYKGIGASYNTTDGGEGALGIKYTDELRKQVSERFKGKPFTEEHKRRISEALKGRPKSKIAIEHMKNRVASNNREVIKCDRKGNYICAYSSIRNASKDTGVVATHISRCARGKRPTAGGYIWKYK